MTTTPIDGTWTTSFSDEKWGGEAFFATRGEAVECAAREGHRYIGRAFNLTDDEVAASFVRDWFEAEEQLQLGGFDVWASPDDYAVRQPSAEEREELHKLVKAWVARHRLRVQTWRVDEMEGPFDWSTAAEQRKGSNDAEPRQAQDGRCRANGVDAEGGAP